MSAKSLFLTFEGTDGVGKSTQIRLLANWLRKNKFKVTLTREPGGGKLAEKIRKILLDPHLKMDNLTELFLYEAARVEHMARIVRPSLKLNKVVLCDRFTDATVAYQGAARGLSSSLIQTLNKIATGGVKPDLTLLLDLSPWLGLKNRRLPDRLEKEGVQFQERVRKGYLQAARKEPRRIKIVPVQEKVMDTQKMIRAIVSKRLWK